jgi:hypothetical protein
MLVYPSKTFASFFNPRTFPRHHSVENINELSLRKEWTDERHLLLALRAISMSAPWSTDVDRFLALVLASGLADQTSLCEACADFKVDRTRPDAVDSLCSHLIANYTLTEWQCHKLRNWKWKGFWMDNYCLLRQVGKTATTATYLAKESSSGRKVLLVVTPRRQWVPGQPIYRVEELPK